MESNNKYALFKLWANGKLPLAPHMGRDHHACDAINRFEMFLANTNPPKPEDEDKS